MSNAVYEAMAGGMAELNTALNDAFMPDGVRCFLLKPDGQSSRFAVVQELTSGYYTKFSEYRSQMQFRYATTDAAFQDKVFQTTKIAFGVPTDFGELEVYDIEDAGRDIISPNAASPFWKLYGTKVPSERFIIPEPEEEP